MRSLKEENELLSSKLLHQGQQLVSQQPVSLAEEMAQAPREEVSSEIKYEAEKFYYIDCSIDWEIFTNHLQQWKSNEQNVFFPQKMQ